MYPCCDVPECTYKTIACTQPSFFACSHAFTAEYSAYNLVRRETPSQVCVDEKRNHTTNFKYRKKANNLAPRTQSVWSGGRGCNSGLPFEATMHDRLITLTFLVYSLAKRNKHFALQRFAQHPFSLHSTVAVKGEVQLVRIATPWHNAPSSRFPGL